MAPSVARLRESGTDRGGLGHDPSKPPDQLCARILSTGGSDPERRRLRISG
jgi:hypothetical protein